MIRSTVVWLMATCVWLVYVSAARCQETDVAANAELRVMSFNLRYGSADDGPNHWDLRKDLVRETIERFDPDLLGTQETLQFQADFLRDGLQAYTYFGRSRMNDPNEQCGIFFRSERFVQLAGGHFWLSETPESPASKSWDAALPRMATWVLLHDRRRNQSPHPSKSVLLVNTHFDHQGSQARLQSAKLIRAKIERLRVGTDQADLIVTGDFNCGEESPPYQALLAGNADLCDTYRAKFSQRDEGEGTFGAWNGTRSGPRIDWILCSPHFRVQRAEIDRWSREGRFPSDHFPVTALLVN